MCPSVSRSASAHHSQSHRLCLIPHNRKFQEIVFPNKKSAYSFLRSTRCILKVLGEVFEKAIICLRSSWNAPSANSCTLIGPMLPLIRKDLYTAEACWSEMSNCEGQREDSNQEKRKTIQSGFMLLCKNSVYFCSCAGSSYLVSLFLCEVPHTLQLYKHLVMRI